jgi:phosphomannomutase
MALVKFTNRRSFLVANDERQFSPEIADAVIEGINEAGGDADYIGESSTPFFNFVLNKTGLNGGVMVTASHNPPDYGGFKLFDEKGSAIFGKDFETIKRTITGDLQISRSGGQRRELEKGKLLADYIDFAIKNSGICRTQVLGVRFEFLENRIINNEIAELLKKIDIKAREGLADIYFSFDGDADRLIVKDEKKEKIGTDLITGLLVQDAIGFWNKPTAVFDQRFSRGVIEKFNEWGIKSFRSKIGRTFVRGEMMKKGADIAGELSGHIFFKKTNYNEMPILAALKILKTLSKSGKKIGEIVEQFKTWANSGEINIAISDLRLATSEIFLKLKERYNDGIISEDDGITVEYPEWWFNLRPSNTEPVLRLIVEAKTKELLIPKIDELESEIKNEA